VALLVVADYWKPPTADEIDLAAYTGVIGDPITTRATDEFEVVGVTVLVRDASNAVLEQGAAALTLVREIRADPVRCARYRRKAKRQGTNLTAVVVQEYLDRWAEKPGS
jgi:hypothetical protein